MAFEPNKWADGEEGGTPITAAELNRIEAAGAAKAAKGDQGEPGPSKGVTETLAVTSEQIGTWTIEDDGSSSDNWPNRLQLRFSPDSGEEVETFALNEYGEPRIIPGKPNTVGFRVFEKQYNSSPTRSASVPVMQVMNDRDNRESQWAIYRDGHTEQTGDAVVEGNLTAGNLPPAILTLNAGEPVPSGTPAGTWIARRTPA